MNISATLLDNNIRLVVFDLDGTLYPKSGMVWRMLLAAPSDWKKMLAERKTRKQMRGMWVGPNFCASYFDLMAKFCKSTQEDIEKWYLEKYMPTMVEVIRRHYKAASWVKPFIEQCSEKKIKMVVLSDYGHTHEKLAALGIDENLFNWVISAPELGGLKPARQLMEIVVEKMGVSYKECLVVGDRLDTDGAMAQALGATFYLIKQ